jgi:alkylation response protein AidB-like acyl-CoA dehydrogenase
MLMKWGSEEQKADLLPKIRDGELLVSIGYTEPAAGTDLASLTTRAVRDGDEWVIDGQKVFTTHAGDADYVWLAARTDPDAPKHKGISIIMVPTSDEGFSKTPIRTIGGEMTFATYYENIRVPVTNTVGPVNGGWGLITGQLNLERITLAMPASLDRLFEEVWAWATETERPGGGRVADEPWVQEALARVYTRVEALKVMNWRSAWLMDQGTPGMAEASAVKVFGTETVITAYRDLLEITRQPGLVRRGQPRAMADGLLESAYRLAMVNTFGGGVNEVQRDIIAMAGLGLPRASRR